jgi:hypothetical protein
VIDFIPCAVRRLESWQELEAAKTAVEYNPANAPNINALARTGLVFDPAHIAMLTMKYWGTKGVHLSVQFLDTQDSSLQSRILSHMNAWGERSNVKFSLTRSQGNVRIARTPGQGFWSYLGTDVLHIAYDQPTMNLEAFTLQTPESEYRRVVRHETGHTLGFPHEHMRQALVARLDYARTVQYFEQTQGWNEQMVRQQVLTPLEESQLTATLADQTSIMCYQLPGTITVDGNPIVGGTDINDTDFAFAAKIYPLSIPTPTQGRLKVILSIDPTNRTASITSVE